MDPLIRRAYWQATAALLAAHFGGWGAALPCALALTLAHALHFHAARRTWRALDVQVRWFYLMLLVLGTLPAMAWLHAAQFAGLLLLLVGDYCLAARLLVLLPWNRTQPLTPGLVRWVLLSPPRPGSIADRLRGGAMGAPASTDRRSLSGR